MIHSIILDYGGTLDTNGDHWSHIIREGWQKANVVANEPIFRESYVFGERELERSIKILPHFNFSDLLKIKIRLELQYLASKGLLPPQDIEPKTIEISDYCYNAAKEQIQKCLPILEKLSKDYPIVLVSNFYGNLEAVLKDFGIFKFFRKVIDSSKVGIRKPDPDIFKLAIKELGDAPSDILVIGDSYENDIIPAQKLGCQALWLKGKSWNETREIDSSVETISSLEDVLDFLCSPS